jgi:hypothetical protein
MRHSTKPFLLSSKPLPVINKASSCYQQSPFSYRRFAGSQEDYSVGRLVGHSEDVRTHHGYWQELVKQFVMATSAWGDTGSGGGCGSSEVDDAIWLYGFQTEAGLAQAQLNTTLSQHPTAARHYDYRYLDPFAVVVLDGTLDTVAQCVVGSMVLDVGL